MNLNFESWFQFSDMLASAKSSTQKMNLITFEFHFLTIFALLKFENFVTLPNAELVHNDIYQKIQYNANFSIKGYKGEIYIIVKNNDDSNFRLFKK